MDILYKWEISGIDGTPKTDEGLENVALAIHWICRGYLEDYDSICNNRQGVVLLDLPSSTESFIPIQEVTEELAFSWLFSKLDKAKIESDITESLSYAEKLLEIEAKTPLVMSWKPNVTVNADAQ